MIRAFSVRWLVLLYLLTPVRSGIAGDARETNAVFHRILWGATFLSSNEWNWVSENGFTLVESYASDPLQFRGMLDQAHKRGVKMITSSGGFYFQPATWLKIAVDTTAPGAATEVWPHVAHHFSQAMPTMVLYGGGLTGLGDGIVIPLGTPGLETVGQVANHLNALGGGIVATVMPGKAEKPATHLATGWYGNAAAAPVSLSGGEVKEAGFKRFVDLVKDHPALYCFAPFDDTDLSQYSPSFQRHVRMLLGKWAPAIPAYLLVSSEGLTPGSGGHDHKLAFDSFDGIITYVYPLDWENSGTYQELESIRYLLQDWWGLHRWTGSKELLLLTSAFNDGGTWITPPGAVDWQWQAACRSDVPLAGYGYWVWNGGFPEQIQDTPRLRQETAALNRKLAQKYLQLTVESSSRRILGNAADVSFQALVRGGSDHTVCAWNFGDGGRAWGQQAAHHFTGPGVYEVNVQANSTNGAAATSARVCLLGQQSLLLQRDFNDNSASGFVTQAGNWLAVEGVLRQTNAAATDARVSLATGAGRAYTLATDVQLTGDRNRFWVIYAAAGDSARYRLEVKPLQSAAFKKEGLTVELRLFTETGSFATHLAWDRSRVYQLTVDVLPGVVLASVDGQLLLEGVTGIAADGVVGFGAEGGAADFDNLRIFLNEASNLMPAVQPNGDRQFAFSAGYAGGMPPASYLWIFGDGGTSTNESPVHDYAQAGAYAVQLWVTNSAGASQRKQLVVLAGPQRFFREAEDYDWRTETGTTEYPTNAVAGQSYAAGKTGTKGVDFRQARKNLGNANNWRDVGQVSLYQNPGDAGIQIGWTSPGDWWNYSFDFPSAGMIQVRGLFAAADPVICRVFLGDQYLFDLPIPGNGWEHPQWVESPAAAVGSGPGTLRFVVLNGNAGGALSFDRFEVAFAGGLDSDGDGLVDLVDPDNDNDGYRDDDERTNNQSDPLDASSRPPDADVDHISNVNDADIDGDGLSNESDTCGLIPNHAPVVELVLPQVAYPGEMLSVPLSVFDVDVPAQHLAYRLEDIVPSGASISPDGVFTWMPNTNHAGQSFTIGILVTDDGQAPRTNHASFVVQVRYALPDSLAMGFASISVPSTNGLFSLVLPQKLYRFAASNQALYVAPDGSDSHPGTLELPWRTFNHALGQLAPGDLLFARGGEYREVLTVRRSGTELKPIVIAAFPGEVVQILQPEGWQETNPTGSTVTFDWDCRHVWFHGFEVHGGWRPDVPVPWGYSRACINLGGGSHPGLRILNNICRHAYDEGIRGEYLMPRGDFLLEGNVILESSRGIGLYNSAALGAILRGNAIINCQDGVSFAGVNGVSAYANLIYGALGSGIFLDRAAENMVAHNVLAGNGTGLLFSGQSCSNTIMNNLFIENWQFHLGSYVGSAGSDLSNLLDHCFLDSASDFASPADWFAPWIGTNQLRGDPLVANPGSHDYRVQSVSPCRLAGGATTLLGALPSGSIGLISAAYFWEPELTALPVQSVTNQQRLQVQFKLSNPNPSSTNLAFQLLEGAPSGVSLDGTTGNLTWTPSAAVSPGTYAIPVQATADASPLLVATGSVSVVVAVPPLFETQPLDQLAQLNEAVSLSAPANAFPAPDYQWWKDGSLVPWGTNQVITLTNVQAGVAGSYWVVVSNPAGSLTSRVASVTINHPPTPIHELLTRSAFGGAKVLISTLLANDSDADGDTVAFMSVSATSTNGGTITTNGGWIHYQPPSLTNTNLDAFSYTISDGRGGQATGWVLVSSMLDTSPSPNLSIASPIPGTFVISFDGIPGLTYRIQSATNVTVPDWFTLGSATADQFGRFFFTNTPPSGETNRYYRSLFP